MTRARYVSRLALACLALATSSAFAAPMDDRIPQDALFYAGWQGADALTPQYTGSNLQHLVDNSGLGAYLQQQLPRWIERAGQQDPQVPQKVQQVMTALNVLWHHPTAVYIGPMDWTDMKNPSPRIAMLCDAGADAAALQGVLHDAVANAPRKPAPTMAVSEKNGLVVVTIGNVSADVFAAGPAMLRANADYQRVMKAIGGSDGAYTIYGDPQKFLATLDEGLSRDKTLPPDAHAKVEAVIHTLGLESLTQGGSRGGFDGKGWADTAFVGAKEPRTGALALAATAPLDDAALGPVPANAAAFSAGRFDLGKTLALAREVVGDVNPQAVTEFNKGLAMVGQQVGFDIEKDLVGSIGDLFVMYRMPSPDGVGIANVLAMPLKNSDGFAKVLSAVETQINQKGDGRVQVEPLDADGIPVSAVQSPFASVAWTVRNGYFYISTFAAISAAVNQVEKHQPSIVTSESYKKVRATLPAVPATTISYNDPAQLYPEAYRVLSSTLPLLRAMKIDVPMRIFPTPAKATPFMAPGMGVSWQDAEGFHFAGKSSFPGADGASIDPADPTAAAMLHPTQTPHNAAFTNATPQRNAFIP